MILICNNQKQCEGIKFAPSPRENENQQVHITNVPLLSHIIYLPEIYDVHLQ